MRSRGCSLDDPSARGEISLSLRRYMFAIAFLHLTSCSPEQPFSNDGNVAAAQGAASVTIDVPGEAVEADVAYTRDAVTECRDLDGAPCPEPPFDHEEASEEALKEKRSSAWSLCWEGYCPCQPPQVGPDQLLCDQLRMGNADPRMLSVGKSMRETRRQIDEYEL